MSRLFYDSALTSPLQGDVLYEGLTYYLNLEGHSTSTIEDHLWGVIQAHHPRNPIAQLRFDNLVGFVNVLGHRYDVRSRKLQDGENGNAQFQALLNDVNRMAAGKSFRF